MNEGEQEQIRQKLLSLKSEIKELEETFRETGKPVELDQSSVGRLSRMDSMQLQQMALEAIRTSASAIKDRGCLASH
jgi:DnaK suppressor protein